MKKFSTAQKAMIIIVIYLILLAAHNWMNHDYFTDVLIDNMRNDVPVTAADLTLSVSDPTILRIEKIWDEDDKVMLTLSPGQAGETNIEVINKNTGMTMSEFYRVGLDGVITNLANGNFSNYRISQLLIILLLTNLTVLLGLEFQRSQRIEKYSYNSIFCIGFGIWLAVIDVILLIGYLNDMDMLNTYATIKNAAFWFINLSFPVLLIGAILLAISNIELIRKEGAALVNFLGIAVGFLVICGWAGLLITDNHLAFGGSELSADVIAAIESIFYCIYALMEGFLLGAVICGKIAAHRQPKEPVDYMIILGCQIKKDGSLYPLVRGRADKAIAFGKEQERKGGPLLQFVPSGGQGRDECLSEGEAMRHYLIDQGIEENRVFAETKADNTRENMIFSKEIIDRLSDHPKVAFATTNYHVFRSGIIARQCGFDFEGIGSRTKWYFWPNAYVREVVGMLSYKWKTLVLLFISITAFFVSVQFVF